jgi:hypothetical protein
MCSIGRVSFVCLDSITGNNARVLLEDAHVNLSSTATVQRVYAFVFYNEQELDGRYLSTLTLSPSQFTGPFYIQSPLTYMSNLQPMNVVKQRDLQQITYTGKVSRQLIQTALFDYWQNPVRQGLTNANIIIVQYQQYLVYTVK